MVLWLKKLKQNLSVILLELADINSSYIMGKWFLPMATGSLFRKFENHWESVLKFTKALHLGGLFKQAIKYLKDSFKHLHTNKEAVKNVQLHWLVCINYVIYYQLCGEQ